MALTSVLVYLLAQSVWGPLPALISALIWMTYPFALWLTKQQGSEMPFLVVFYGGVYLFWRALLRRDPLLACCTFFPGCWWGFLC